MATAARRAKSEGWRDSLREGSRTFGRRLLGLAVFLVGLGLGLALLTHDSTDPSLSTAAGGPPANWLGSVGAYVSDFTLLFFGIASALLVPLLMLAGIRMMRLAGPGRRTRKGLLTLAAMLVIGIAIGLYTRDAVSGLPAGWGGVIGMAGAAGIDALIGLIDNGSVEGALRLSLVAIGLVGGLALGALALDLREEEKEWIKTRLARSERGDAPVLKRPRKAAEEEMGSARPPKSAPQVAEPSGPVVRAGAQPAKKKRKGRGSAADQPGLALGDNYQLPSLDLLAPVEDGQVTPVDKAALERNARLLESVLEDFHVRGDIVEVRPGPVVTMYELEPASGIKASRVIQLADDIARNMSALSARVATIPGRSVIGIELPNKKRDMVMLSELIGSQDFADQDMALPLILGKDISGDPVIADLAPMPHLLVAGTTGSGKSVGLNAMILSLLYRMGPDECRLIMIDPKMLELSVYDDIPHLLSPVVTEPAKAIRALKWTVEQMEERYRMMASLGVRQLASFNKKVAEAKAKGKTLGRRVQTGYDADTGQPTYETEELDYDTLPQIVVVVDELADLMMTAGKEVEFLIQRLAQKARAAGIHLIMATQRPSVDVITGVIKANLPTRISFHVTSKIDSRTILGEQGAEQLLGKGDMLYMAGGKRILRVHGPFVADDEVRKVADHWRAQGQPDYIQAVTEEPEDGGYLFDGQPVGEDDAETQQFRQAVQIVAESQKASTSYLQRQMRVGYNTAARLIERMEKEGLVSGPDHVGRREVMIDPDGNPL
ncbi:DNA translocase FtsK [Sphingomicrobium lutaoense]|uniref:DNA translocase FtsK n=1 Tax=Sphingomicrobium lutaoense TaxID=515949 RepID=A0A839Z3W2_9SPHN|nr:DNA translocase FtsK [Sphingomicrobium lutaoense]MBB3764777.1 S-DNA-T family DNA segregation ATPase FtsK/SpoIIIE [Sphingomicrobium lutaoense]